MTEKPSAPERVQSALAELSTLASELNSASDELVATISDLNAALQDLNLGISAWVPLASGSGWRRDLGYAKIRNEWGIAIRKLSVSSAHLAEADEEKWTFAAAPRWMRVEAVGKIPDLLEKLIKATEDASEKIRKKTEEAKAITLAVMDAVGRQKPHEQHD